MMDDRLARYRSIQYIRKRSQADKITAITSAASVEVEPIWASLLAKALEGKDVKSMLSNIGAGGGAPAAAGPGAAAAGGAAAGGAEPAAEEKKEEAKEGEFAIERYRYHSRNGRLTVSRIDPCRVRRRHGIRTVRLNISQHSPSSLDSTLLSPISPSYTKKQRTSEEALYQGWTSLHFSLWPRSIAVLRLSSRICLA
jgi:ribosomal protein L12E/L44/L45/RPP1/RPP2